MLVVPAPALFIATEDPDKFPKQFPVIFKIPVELFNNAIEFAPLPPVTDPVIVNVPVLVFATPKQLAEVPPLIFPTIKADAGDADEKDRQLTDAVVDLLVTFAVKVTPEFKTNVPVPALLNSVQVTFAVIVTTCVVEARASSAAPGTMPPTQVAPALKFPVAAERISAIFYRPFAKINS
jgi:hypothetical protein